MKGLFDALQVLTLVELALLRVLCWCHFTFVLILFLLCRFLVGLPFLGDLG